MSGTADELDNFLDVLLQRLQAVSADDPNALRRTLQDGDAIDLALHTSDLEDGLDWLVGTVRTTAWYSPSAAFALAGRYAVQHGQHAAGVPVPDSPASGVVNATADHPWTVTAPALLDPATLILLDRSAATAAEVAWESLEVQDPGAVRSGLRQAGLRTLRPRGDVVLLPSPVARAVARSWDLLTAAAALGIAQRALTESESYAGDRHQFGAPISSFAGLRAILAEMALQVSGVNAQLSQALSGEAPGEDVLATAGRVAVDVCLDAIQVHGGYGYIDEYPLAGLLRDALSIRARGGGRRALVAQVAARRLGTAAVHA